MMEPVETVDGKLVIDLLEAVGVNWRDVFEFRIDLPGILVVRHYLRNEDGKFYRDDSTYSAAEETVTRVVRWPS